jgi:hypothetical protein
MSTFAINWYGAGGGSLPDAIAQGAIIPVVIGPPGTGGGGSGGITTLLCGTVALGALRGAYVAADGKVYLATPSTPVPSGLTTTAAAAGATINLATSAVISDAGWAWAPGPVFLAATLSRWARRWARRRCASTRG